MDYGFICQTVQAHNACPASINPQIWKRMVRVAKDPKLVSVAPVLLPTSLSALVELIRLPSVRIDELVVLGVLGPGLTASRIREIGASGPIPVLVEAVVEQDGSVKVGGIVRGK